MERSQKYVIIHPENQQDAEQHVEYDFFYVQIQIIQNTLNFKGNSRLTINSNSLWGNTSEMIKWVLLLSSFIFMYL